MERIARWVRGGVGLLMIGGWDSFQGSGGSYDRTVVGELLPVSISPSDDRVNTPFPCLVHKREEHPILAGLPFGEPPCVGGFVDWGDRRILCRIPEAEVEVGAFYAAFFANLVLWTAGSNLPGIDQ